MARTKAVPTTQPRKPRTSPLPPRPYVMTATRKPKKPTFGQLGSACVTCALNHRICIHDGDGMACRSCQCDMDNVEDSQNADSDTPLCSFDWERRSDLTFEKICSLRIEEKLKEHALTHAKIEYMVEWFGKTGAKEISDFYDGSELQLELPRHLRWYEVSTTGPSHQHFMSSRDFEIEAEPESDGDQLLNEEHSSDQDHGVYGGHQDINQG